MLLVMYSYKKYSNFSLTLSVSTSQATTINICELPHDSLSLEASSYFSVRNHSCIVLQLDHGQANMSIYRSNKYRNRKVGANHITPYTGVNFIGRK